MVPVSFPFIVFFKREILPTIAYKHEQGYICLHRVKSTSVQLQLHSNSTNNCWISAWPRQWLTVRSPCSDRFSVTRIFFPLPLHIYSYARSQTILFLSISLLYVQSTFTYIPIYPRISSHWHGVNFQWSVCAYIITMFRARILIRLDQREGFKSKSWTNYFVLGEISNLCPRYYCDSL